MRFSRIGKIVKLKDDTATHDGVGSIRDNLGYRGASARVAVFHRINDRELRLLYEKFTTELNLLDGDFPCICFEAQ